jgi:UDP-N-acetylmuramate--alanine ligase
MSLFAPSDNRPVHFVGIAGAGMSALAELLVRRGVAVTGCDANPAAADDLRALGVDVLAGHDPAHVEGARAVVVTSAVRRDHPELERAITLGIPVIRRAEALAEAISAGETVGIAGTHGKTTTTVLTTEVLRAAGLDPTGLAGGRVGSWSGNYHRGAERIFVVEADEYDRSFLALAPAVAVITNVEADHLDIYRDLSDIREAFTRFVEGARAVVLCADDPGASTLSMPVTAEVIRYGIDSPDARLIARALQSAGSGVAFTIVFDGRELGEAQLSVPGRHNVLNALAAIGVGIAYGAPAAGMIQGLANFRGVERRFQRMGEVAGVLVVDDYAHHPTEIRATLQAARTAFPGRRLVAAFQPHLYSRTRDFASEFGKALAAADAVYLTAVYAAREQPIPGVSEALVADATTRAGGTVLWRGERAELAQALADAAAPGDLVLTLGAGDITRSAAELLALLARSGGT